MLVGGHALVTGQIARTTSFEKGSPTQVAGSTESGNRIRGFTMTRQ